jgi:inner membrane protein
MKNPLLQKCAFLMLLCALLFIPLTMVESTISERAQRREDAVEAIANSTARAQAIVGPVMTVTVEESYDEIIAADGKARTSKTTVRSKRAHVLVVPPHNVHFDGNLSVERRAYGLHGAAVYDMVGSLTGEFETPSSDALPPLGANATLVWGAPTLSVGISDARGLSSEPTIELDGKALKAQQASRIESMATGFQGSAQAQLNGKKTRMPFKVNLRLVGTQSIGFIPLGETSTATLQGNWQHPSFGGSFLPRKKEVGSNGFAANWSTTGLASNTHAGKIDPYAGFQVRLIEPVDVYQQALRAVKYGILFVVLSFAAFFMFEQIKALPIHPIQYLLVGLAQALFFLLLTSLSEHIAFNWAYAVSSCASIGLISLYLGSVLHSWLRSLGFSLGLVMLYTALFGILRSEQNALLLGSLLLFFSLTALMLGTRKIDWYRYSQPKAATPAPVSAPIPTPVPASTTAPSKI